LIKYKASDFGFGSTQKRTHFLMYLLNKRQLRAIAKNFYN